VKAVLVWDGPAEGPESVEKSIQLIGSVLVAHLLVVFDVAVGYLRHTIPSCHSCHV